MQISTKSKLTGCKPVDFEQHQFVSLYVEAGVKSGDGLKSQKLKYENLADYERVKGMIGKNVELTGVMETNDKNESAFLVQSLKVAA